MKKDFIPKGLAKRLMMVSALICLFVFVSSAGADSPKPTGEIRIALGSLGNETMDPVLTSNSGKPMMTPFYDYIIGVDANGKLSKDTGVARDWKLAPDAMSLTIFVRPGIKFHNGDDLTGRCQVQCRTVHQRT